MIITKDTQMRVKLPEDKIKGAKICMPDFVRDGYFYRDNQYLGSFIRRANQFVFGGSGHGAYGEAEIEIVTNPK